MTMPPAVASASAAEPPRPRPRYHHRPHHLDFASAGEVPDSHAWPLLHDHPTASPDLAVPVVDLSAARRSDLLDQLARACSSWGAFQLTGHGVPPALLCAAETAARRLFALPIPEKLRAARADDGRGISGYGSARISCFFPKLMWSEGFTITGSPLDHARLLWPEGDPSAFCNVIEEYRAQMQRLARRLTRLMLMSLGPAAADGGGCDEELNWAGPTDRTSAVVQLNSYPACPDPDRAMGLAAHTDSTLLTLLYQSDASGLQVLHHQDGDDRPRWVTVPPLPAALVVNVGDLLQIVSNGRYRSVVHRAVVNRKNHRISVAYMCGPSADTEVSPAGELVRTGGRPLYRTVKWDEYLALKGELFDGALPHLMRREEEPPLEEDSPETRRNI